MKSQAIFCLCKTRAEWCLGWSRHWCGAGEALSSHWAHSYWKCTQGKMHLRKALSERHSWAWESRVIDWWCTDSWLQIDTVLTNSAPNSLHMLPSPVAFHYNILFTVLSQNISHYRAVRQSKHHLFFFLGKLQSERRGDNVRLLVVQPRQPSLGRWGQSWAAVVRVAGAAEDRGIAAVLENGGGGGRFLAELNRAETCVEGRRDGGRGGRSSSDSGRGGAMGRGWSSSKW